MSSLLQDLRYAIRGFIRRAGFTTVVVVTLALGIGSNVAIFSVANAVLFSPLPYLEPERLVLVWNRSKNADVGRSLVSGPDFLDYKEQTTLFADFAGAFAINGTMTGEGKAEQLLMGWSTENLFKVLGVRMILGRDFSKEDEIIIDPKDFTDPNAAIPPGVLILSHALWQQRFGGDPDVLGRSVEMDGQASNIVGVLPPDFRIYLPEDAGMPTNVDVWRVLPIAFDTNPRDAPWVTVVTRLKPQVSLEQAQSEMDALAARLREQYQFHANSGMQIELNSMHADVVRHVRPTLFALFGAGGFVLLIACANVANLMLARAATREREVAVRASLGGSQGRIIRQMLVESGVLAVAGGLGGLAFAWGGIRVLLSLRPENLPRLEEVALDGTVMVFAMATTLLAAIVFGLVPALRSATPDLAFALKERGSEMGGIRGNKLRTGLVILEVALSLVLLIGAGLLFRSFSALQKVEPGFKPDNVLTFSVSVPGFKYREPQVRTDFLIRFRDRIDEFPGVRGVGGVSPLPLAGGDQYYVFSYGRMDASEDEWTRNKADYRWITPGYFQAMGIPLVSGRFTTTFDNQSGALEVVIVDEMLAKRTWPDADPIGQQIRVARFNVEDFSVERVLMQVVGVVGHVRSESLAAEGREAIYFPLRSFPYVPQSFAVRTTDDVLGFVKTLQSEIEAMDPDVPIADVRLMSSYVKGAMSQTRFTLTLIGVFAGLALILASIGLYGVMSYSVHQRTQEIGVRMAFGAEESNILRLVVGQGVTLALCGVGVGLLVAFFLTRMAASLLFDVAATDPVTFAVISLLLVAVATLASYFPARRAMSVDPIEALRGERVGFSSQDA